MRLCGLASSSGSLFSHPMPVGVGYWFHRFFSFTPFATRHTGVRALLGQTLEITEDHGVSGWFWIAGD